MQYSKDLEIHNDKSFKIKWQYNLGDYFMGKIKTDELEERVGSAGITVNSTVKVDTITEKTTDAGVTIEGVTLKDGAVVGAVDIGLIIALG